jgi:hypothetical protein
MKQFCINTLLVLFFFGSFAQKTDSTVAVGKNMITLSEVVINNKLNIAGFITRIKNDSSFYKAFRNLHILQFSAINDIRMNNSEGEAKAGLHSKTMQERSRNCRKMSILEEQISGDIYDDDHNFNYYTAQMYASLFFTKDSVCGEDNIVAGREFNTAGKSGMDKHKEQLKMLFFNPGKRINGIPFLSDKTAIFDDDMADKYDMNIDMDIHDNTSCYVFTQKVKPGKESDVVIDEMTTWFDAATYDVLARNYSLSYEALVYDFKIKMEVQLKRFDQYMVPSLIRYNGNWKAIFKKRERGIFTATLFDYTVPNQ